LTWLAVRTNIRVHVGGLMSTINLTVNGQVHTVDVDPATPLLYVLSDDLHLRGPKFGCGLGQCGACTVLVHGRAIRSCVTQVGAMKGAEITTLEGLGSIDRPHPLQQAFIDEQALHCGYCYNGMTIKGAELLANNPKPSEADIRSTMNGHLCRCGTYPRIMKAIQVASQTISGGTP
jgi:nicotinate dehydrogenase subunit A